jgi:lipopolysaccharide/colanic/teichoic acid biosynthesis glycosyltransferase
MRDNSSDPSLRTAGGQLKRGLDMLLTLVTLPLWLPLLGLVALIVRLGMGSPVFFRQVRPGWREQRFTLIKFRTMRLGTGDDVARLTPLGRWLRRTSLDELPELFNVLRGEMSLVGPRPLLVAYLERYSAEQRRRHEVRPGLTGWAQIHGRNALSWDERLRLDVWYVEHHSLGLDLRILFSTARQVIRGHGIAAEGHATMPEFFGAASSRPSSTSNSRP